MAFWQVSDSLKADPAVVETTALATLPLRLDVARYLEAGQALPGQPAPRTTLTDLTTGRDVDLPQPRMDGTTIVQVVKDLERGHDYRLVWNWTIGAFDRPSRITIVRVVG